MQVRFRRRLEIVRSRIEELEPLVGDAIIANNQEREELRELYAEAEFLEKMAA
jgi:hypothetical protein